MSKKINKKDRKAILRQERFDRGFSPMITNVIEFSDRSYGVTKEPMRVRYEPKNNTWVKITEHIVMTYYRAW